MAPLDVDPEPACIGRYRIVRRIASGGMGTVYEAEQDSPRRTVALKLLTSGIASRSLRQRFEAEAGILARLRHPGIAQVYDAGVSSDATGGVPFFAMEFVADGRPITSFARETGLNTRQRIELFAEVCDAVHHGHQKGVIHRDIKPANVLVDEEGRSKVIDFGVACVTDSDVARTTVRADAGQLVGTLQYMSPEQCEGDSLDIDTRSDVYSLGVVLYELMCDKLPYDLSGSSIPGATRIIQDYEPVAPGTVARSLRGNVTAIVLRALAKDRDRRYQSAAEMAADMRRHLRGEPVEARGSTAWTRLIGFTVRHPVAMTVATCLAIAVATLGGSWALTVYLNSSPYRVEIAEGGGVVRLLAISGRPIETWQSETGQLNVAELVLPADNPAGSALVILGYNRAHRGPRAGALCVFDPDADPAVPVWQGTIGAGDAIPSFPPETYPITGYSVAWAEPIDVFPQRPGHEIAAIFNHAPSSAAVLRVYDLEGRLLFQLWHHGTLGPCVWLPDAQMMLVMGSNGEAYWSRRGRNDVRRPHPIVIFSVTPRIGHIGRTVTSPSPGHGLATVNWYRCILPADSLDALCDWRFNASEPHERRGRTTRLDMALVTDPTATVQWLVDEYGNLSSPITSDAWNLADDKSKPNPEEFYLGELPPIQ